jgi:hypothetical protein
MRRTEPKTFAAHHDPWTIDRQLRNERADHLTIIERRPPDLRRNVRHAQERHANAHAAYTDAVEYLAQQEAARNQLGRFTPLRPRGRKATAAADQKVEHARHRLAHAATRLEHEHAQLTRLDSVIAARARWDRQHAWRIDRLAELDGMLAHQWADVVLRAVRADDPLAFGAQRLHDARATYQADLQHTLTTFKRHHDHAAYTRLTAAIRDLDAALDHTEPARDTPGATHPRKDQSRPLIAQGLHDHRTEIDIGIDL